MQTEAAGQTPVTYYLGSDAKVGMLEDFLVRALAAKKLSFNSARFNAIAIECTLLS